MLTSGWLVLGHKSGVLFGRVIQYPNVRFPRRSDMIGLVGKRMRPVLLKLHLLIGVSAAIFLVILGVTGSIIAFEGDIDHWLHLSMWYVNAGGAPLPESALILAVEQRYAPSRIAAVHIFRERN